MRCLRQTPGTLLSMTLVFWLVQHSETMQSQLAPVEDSRPHHPQQNIVSHAGSDCRLRGPGSAGDKISASKLAMRCRPATSVGLKADGREENTSITPRTGP